MLLQVKQRDSEIAIMIGMVKGRSSSIAQVSPATAATGDAAAGAAGSTADAGPAANGGSSSNSSGQVLSALLDARLLADRHAAFEVFRKSYRQGEVRTRPSDASGLGQLWSVHVGMVMPSHQLVAVISMMCLVLQTHITSKCVHWSCVRLLLPGY